MEMKFAEMRKYFGNIKISKKELGVSRNTSINNVNLNSLVNSIQKKSTEKSTLISYRTKN